MTATVAWPGHSRHFVARRALKLRARVARRVTFPLARLPLEGSFRLRLLLTATSPGRPKAALRRTILVSGAAVALRKDLGRR